MGKIFVNKIGKKKRTQDGQILTEAVRWDKQIKKRCCISSVGCEVTWQLSQGKVCLTITCIYPLKLTLKKSSWCTTQQLGRVLINLFVRVVLPPLVTLRNRKLNCKWILGCQLHIFKLNHLDLKSNQSIIYMLCHLFSSSKGVHLVNGTQITFVNVCER